MNRRQVPVAGPGADRRRRHRRKRGRGPDWGDIHGRPKRIDQRVAGSPVPGRARVGQQPFALHGEPGCDRERDDPRHLLGRHRIAGELQGSGRDLQRQDSEPAGRLRQPDGATQCGRTPIAGEPAQLLLPGRPGRRRGDRAAWTGRFQQLLRRAEPPAQFDQRRYQVLRGRSSAGRTPKRDPYAHAIGDTHGRANGLTDTDGHARAHIDGRAGADSDRDTNSRPDRDLDTHPDDSPTPTAAPTPAPTPTEAPTPTPTDSPTPAPAATPTPAPTDSPTPTPTPTPIPTDSLTPTPTA